MIKKIIYIIALILFYAYPLWAADWYVAADGSGTACTAGTECSLDYAIDTKASTGDTIYLEAGTYNQAGSTHTISIDLTFVGADEATTIVDDAGQITMSGVPTVSNITFTNGNDWRLFSFVNSGTIDGASFSNCTFDNVRGALRSADNDNSGTISNFTVDNCTFKNVSAASAFGIFIEDGTLTDFNITNNTFSDYTSTGAGDVVMCGVGSNDTWNGPSSTSTDIDITGNTFTNITGVTGYEAHGIIVYGNDIYLYNNTASTCTLFDNHEIIYWKASNSTADANTVVNGGGYGGEGAMNLKGGAVYPAGGNVISNNIITGSQSGGGGLFTHGDPTIEDNIISLSGSSGKGIRIWPYGESATVTGNIVESYKDAFNYSNTGGNPTAAVVTNNCFSSRNEEAIDYDFDPSGIVTESGNTECEDPDCTCPKTYYVDSVAGSDGNTGLSDAQAWATISKVNSSVSGESDKVYFKCGGTWINSILAIDWGGTSGDRAIVGAYYGSGTIGVSGTKPIIDGEYTYPTATWSYLIGIENQDYVTLTNIRVINSLARAIWIDESSYIDVLNCDVNKAYRTGIGFGGATSNSSAIGCTVTDVAWVYQVADWPAAIFCMNGCDSMVFRGNTVHNNWGEGIGLYYHTTNSLVENNFVYENRRVNIYNGSSRNNIIRYNLIFGHGNSTNGHGIAIDDEQWHDDAYSENVEIYGNFIAYCYVGFYFGTSHEDSVFKDHKIYSNTLVDNVRNMGFYGNKDAENSEIKDNIFYCITGGGCSNLSWTADSDIDFDYNLWSSEPDTNAKGANDLSYADPVILRTSGWRSLGGENGVVTDFALQSGSPAINAGLDLGNVYDDLLDAENTDYSTMTFVTQLQSVYGYVIGADINYENVSNPTPTTPEATGALVSGTVTIIKGRN